MSKSAKRRVCPAAGREITAAECGEGRHSRFACPADCPFNPFSPHNYDAYLELEEAADGAMIRQLNLDAPDPSELRRVMSRLQDKSDTLGLVSEINLRGCYRRDAQGQTLMESWEKRGFPGVKNDLRVVLRRKMQVRVSLLEVHRVLDSEQVEVVDILDPDPQPGILQDRSLAAIATRFMVGIGWMYPAPHFYRLVGALGSIPFIRGLPPRQILLELCRHLGAPEDESELRSWLAENLGRVIDAGQATAQARHQMMLENLDAHFGKAQYRLSSSFEAVSLRLQGQEDLVSEGVSEEDRPKGVVREWAVLDRSPTDPEGPGVLPGAIVRLGRILVGRTDCRLEGMGTGNFAKLRARFESLVGDTVEFVSASSEDLRPRISATGPKPELTLVPPSLLANPERLLLSTTTLPGSKTHQIQPGDSEHWKEAFDRAFLDEGVPALGGMTPRQAANDPKFRPTLICLMKERVKSCDEENLKTGGNRDVNWMLRELNLTEILFDPPPRREPPSGEDNRDAGEDLGEDVLAEDEMWEMDPSLPPAPPLPGRPFTLEEVEARTEAILRSSPTASETLNRVEADGCTLISDVGVAAEELLSEDAMDMLVPLLIMAWGVFVPPGTRGNNLSVAGLREAIAAEVASIPGSSPPSLGEKGDLKSWVASGPQPNLVLVLVGHLNSLMKSDQQASSLVSELPGLLVVIRAVVAELDAENRA